jgi:hypothetical protein
MAHHIQRVVAALVTCSACLSYTTPLHAGDDPAYVIEFNDGSIAPRSIEVPANTGASAVEFESLELRKEKVLGPGVTSFIVIRRLDPGEYAFFDDFHLELAQHEWARLKANDSLECRNCHSSVAMDLSKQTQRAAEIHTRYLLSGSATCIDCHKGIAHELPNMQGVDPGWKMPPELEGEKRPSASAIDDLKQAIANAHKQAFADQ